MKKFLFIILFIFIASIFVFNFLTNYFFPLSDLATTESDGLIYQLKTNKLSYHKGEPMNLSLSLKNNTSRAIVFRFPTTEQCNFLVKKEMNYLLVKVLLDVWQSSYKKRARDIPTSFILKPGEKKIFTEVWDQVDSKMQPVPPGKYVIIASLGTLEKKTTLQLRTKTTK